MKHHLVTRLVHGRIQSRSELARRNPVAPCGTGGACLEAELVAGKESPSEVCSQGKSCHREGLWKEP